MEKPNRLFVHTFDGAARNAVRMNLSSAARNVMLYSLYSFEWHEYELRQQ